MSRHYKREMPRLKTTKTHSSSIPKSLALEKLVKTYSLKVQPSLFNILKRHTPNKIREILIDNLLEGEESHEARGHDAPLKAQNPSRRGLAAMRSPLKTLQNIRR